MTKQQKLDAISAFEKSEGYPSGSLLDVMIFETAGTLSTAIRNKYSGAVGLFQFMPVTCRNLGYTVEQVASMTFEQQLNLCKRYLLPYRSRLLNTSDRLDFYLAVLYPALIGKPDTAYMAKDRTKQIYIQNRGLDMDKDGDIQKGDIRNFFYKTVNSYRSRNGLPVLTVTAIGSFIVLLLTGYKMFFDATV